MEVDMYSMYYAHLFPKYHRIFMDPYYDQTVEISLAPPHQRFKLDNAEYIKYTTYSILIVKIEVIMILLLRRIFNMILNFMFLISFFIDDGGH